MYVEERMERIEQKMDLFAEQLNRVERMLHTAVSPPETKEFVTLVEASEMFRLAVSTLRSYYERGLIGGSKPGKVLFVNVESVRDYLRRNGRKSIKEEADEICVMSNKNARA